MVVLLTCSFCVFTVCGGRTLTTLQEVYEMSKENCSTIEGPLFIEDLSTEGYYPPHGSDQLPSLDTVEKITQFLVVQRIRERNYTCLSQLLPSLRFIGGHRLYEDRWALVFRDNVHLFVHPDQVSTLCTANRSLNSESFFYKTLLKDQGRNCPVYNNSSMSDMCVSSQTSLHSRHCEEGEFLVRNLEHFHVPLCLGCVG